MKLSKKVSAASLVMALTYGNLGPAAAASAADDAGRADATATIARQKCSGKCNGKCSGSVEKA